MEKITAIFEKIDLAKAVPEMDALLSKVQTATTVALLIGPVLMLLLGLWYYFLPPKEANHKFGYRTYFGMGSVQAWKFTQWIAGIVWGVLIHRRYSLRMVAFLSTAGRFSVSAFIILRKCDDFLIFAGECIEKP